ncbi:ferrochelatase [Aquabacterium lacunae]|jgi:protoporphyrin/coproporphyrin ferrochelatase|uniref:Ferrochelatase n=1 Tax=Aquabacterium lacunae TaxID=2528630 RepID=A0A4V2JFS0_9BURK|nr:ferrochelatase [Aquabacterium lacunae]TBO32406.1 ferrochelatase [Aquabacterium lacunae]
MRFDKEPSFDHARRPTTGVLIVNLGTPEAPTAPALRRYLGQFLSDPRVVEIPAFVWKVILHGIILRVRPAKSAEKYASIWTPEGSPLRVWTERQGKLLQGYLGERGHQVQVRWAMRYGQPSIATELDALKAAGVTRILVVPLYPQYSGATSASVMDDVFAWGRRTRLIPELRFVQHFHDDARYIDALAQSVLQHWQAHGRPDKLMMSFHGMPERTLHLGDPYHCECHKTARLLAERLGLSKEQYLVSFQSRFGKAKWLEPYTEPMLRQLGKAGVKRVDVVCPAFVSDCIETLEEIAMEGRNAFISEGGQEFHYIPCLNDRPQWMTALTQLCEQHMQGWPTLRADQPLEGDLLRTQERAKAIGAKR